MARTSTILTSLEILSIEALASLSPNFAVVTNASGFVESSAVTSTEVGYLSGVTSSIQTQLNSKPGLSDNNTWTGTNTFSNTVLLSTLQSYTSGGITIKSNSGTDVALLGAGGGAGTTFYGSISVQNLFANAAGTFGTNGGTVGSVVLNGSTSGAVTVSVLATAGTWTLTLPDTTGTTGQVLTTDGAGNTSWTTVSGGGSFSWGATASGTSGTGIGLTIDDSASASTTMQSFTWGNTQTNATLYGQQFNYGTSTIAKVGSYHNMTGGTTNAMLVNYGYSGSNISALKITAIAGIPIGTTHGAIYFASALAYSNATSGVGINFSNLTLGNASSCNASAIKFDSIAYGSSTVGYIINANYLAYGSNSQGFGVQFTYLAYGYGAIGKLINIDTMANAGTTVYLINSTYGAAGTGSNVYLINIVTAVASSGGNYLGYYIGNGISGTGTSSMVYVGNGSASANGTFYGLRVGTLATAGTGYAVHITTVGSGATTATAFHIGALNSASNTGGNNIKYLSFSNAQSASLVGQTTTTSEILHSRTHTGATSISDTFDLFHLRKTSVVNNAGGTYTVSGAVLKLENVSTQTAGTLADSTVTLQLIQSSNSTGAPLSITQNYVTSSHFRKLETETNTGKSIWVSNGTSPNGALTGTAGDILYGGDGGKIYYCTGTTNWTSSAGNPVYPSSLYTPGTVHYSDNATLFADVSSTSLRLYSSGANMYNNGVQQTIGITSIWASADGYVGTIIIGGYVYAMLLDVGVATRIYRCSTSSDISVAGNWTQLTISGTSLPFGSTDGLCGYDGTYFYVTASGVGFMRYSLSGTTLTYIDTITVTGATYNYIYDRVNSTGIYAKFATAPHIRFASHSGVLDNKKQSSFNAIGCIALPYSFYTTTSTGTYYLHNF